MLRSIILAIIFIGSYTPTFYTSRIKQFERDALISHCQLRTARFRWKCIFFLFFVREKCFLKRSRERVPAENDEVFVSQ